MRVELGGTAQRHDPRFSKGFTMQIELKPGFICTFDDEDADLIGTGWGLSRTQSGHCYAIRGRGRGVLMHRLIVGATGRQEVDHRDNNGLNNCRNNLRLCTHSQNIAWSRIPPSLAGFRGVTRRATRSSRYQAFLKVNQEKRYLGVFTTAEEAAKAYDDAALKQFGEFARLNFR